MAEQTFRSPGFFEQEIDATAQVQSPVGIPAAVIGTAQKGPAFVPVTIGSFNDFKVKFGGLDPNRFGPYAVYEWLKNRQALTYMRVLGAGSNLASTDFTSTRVKGTVKNAGFKLSAAATQVQGLTGTVGGVQFIVANHAVQPMESRTYPQFTDNSSIVDTSLTINTNLVRGVVFLASGTRMLVLNPSVDKYSYSDLATSALSGQGYQGTLARVGRINSRDQDKYFKLVISSTLPTFGNYEGYKGIRILTASLDPNDSSYISKILNTDPLKFGDEQHLLYLDFPVEHDLAPVHSATFGTVAIVSGTAGTSVSSGDTTVTFQDLFGRFDTRYTTARTTNFISQPFGKKEYDLFNFETLDDGESGNNSYKISIANLRASTDGANPYGTFEVQVRSLYDTDTNLQILERYPNCNLNPSSPNFVARMIGDKKAFFDFDQENPNDRRMIITGQYPNLSRLIRVVVSDAVKNSEVPAAALPFGFRGIPTLKTTDSLTDTSTTVLADGSETLGSSRARMTFVSGTDDLSNNVKNLVGSIVPPLPFRIKVTRGPTIADGFLGAPGNNERSDARLYWGVNTIKIPLSSTTAPSTGIVNSLLSPNDGSDFNEIVNAYSKFVGIQKLDALVTGSGADKFNDNKFTLARVTTSQTAGTTPNLANVFSTTNFTGSADQIMRESAYVRNGVPDPATYVISPDGLLNNRFTLASLIATSSVIFNRFTPYAKFTNIFYGGFDGVDITDKDRYYFRDRSLSTDNGGKASTTYTGPLGTTSAVAGSGVYNNNVASINSAIKIVTSPIVSNASVLAIPGIRDPYVTNTALASVDANGLMLYVMDSLKYDSSDNRLYDDSTTKPDPQNTAEEFVSRAVDNSYAATFFPDVSINDVENSRIVKVPSSVAALGVLGYTDSIGAPWFAPAGFNRGSLDFVTNVETRLSQNDRDTLYDARINPIATFPTGGFVVFGQKTLQQAKSALDRINVRRMLIDLKRRVYNVAQGLIFEPNNSQTRARLVAGIIPNLTLIQAQQGIEQFNVICDDTNNTQQDVDSYRMNCRIVIVPTRTVEFISIDFIITNSGVQFV